MIKFEDLPEINYFLAAYQAQSIIDVLEGRNKLKYADYLATAIAIKDSIKVDQNRLDNLRTACITKNQKQVLDEIFGKLQKPCPYKKGEPIAVRNDENYNWMIVLSSGELNQDGNAKSGSGVRFKYHAKLNEVVKQLKNQ